MKKISFRQQKYDEKQKKILNSAAKLFAQKGFGHVSLEEIGARIRLSKASLYHYVKSKDDIVFQLHIKAMNQAIEVLEAAEISSMTPLEKFKKAIRDLVIIATNEDILAYYRVETRFLPKKMRPLAKAKRDQVLAIVHRLIIEGKDAGIIHCKDWRISAFAALGAMNWIPLWYSPKGELSAKEIADAMEDFILRGFGVSTANEE